MNTKKMLLATVFCCASLLAGEAPRQEVKMGKMDTVPGEIVEHAAVPAGSYTAPDGSVHTNIPANTRVQIHLRPEEKSFIRAEVWLPEKWNGRLLGLGNGGAAGGLPVGYVCEATKGGYTVATTDMGTSAGADCGAGNPAVWEDFGHRATHLMTVAAKEIIQKHYGRAPEFSYFQGGSTGGQQALSLAQRYPEDYDGIIAEVPAHCRAPLHAYFLWNYQKLRRTDGSPLFTPEQEKAVMAAGVDYFASREKFPHAKGKFISDPRWTAAEQEEVIKLALGRDSSLTEEHAAALRQVFAGPVNSRTGARIFGGIPPGTDFGPACGNLYLFQWVFGKDVNLMKIDFDRDIEKYLKTLGPVLNAENADLKKFRERGGKIIMISGTADSCVPYHATLDYYERAAAQNGGLDAVREFFLFYLLPGRAHGGGPGLHWTNSTFEKLVAWREKSIVPQLDGFRPGDDGYTVPVFPYPQQTGADGKAFTGARGGVVSVSEEYR